MFRNAASRRGPAGAVVVLAVVFAGLLALPPSGGVARADVTTMAVAVGISPNDTPAQIIAKAASVSPTPRLLAWQRLELTAFIHFGVNTFTGREHGTGTEDPNIFQPALLDTNQWVTALKNAGFKLVILTVKHQGDALRTEATEAGSRCWCCGRPWTG